MKGNGDTMKKLVSLILCLAMILAWLPAGSPFAAAEDSSPFAGGSGTADDPYLVSTPEQLNAIDQYIYSNKYFLQINDIDLQDDYGHCITDDLFLASGAVYDGGGHCITGLRTDTSLFSTNKGIIRNLTLLEPTINVYVEYNTRLTADRCYGILTKYNEGTIENCCVSLGNLYVSTRDHTANTEGTLHQSVGGLAGENTGTISNCCMEGSSNGRVANANNSSRNSGTSVRMIVAAGGIAGWNKAGGTITNCYSTCRATASSYNTSFGIDMPGVICGNNEGTISQSYSGDATIYSETAINEPVGGGDGAVDAETKVPISQDLMSRLSDQSGEPFWGLDESGHIQMNARTLEVSASYPSGICDMPVDLVLELGEGVQNGEIYYTVPGKSAEKERYAGPITLTEDTELLVYGQLSSSVYQVNRYSYRDLRYPVRANQPGGTYDTPILVELHTETGEGTIYYTTDGSDPTQSSTRYAYSGGIEVYGTTTITAVAMVDGVYGDSMTYHYVISPTITAQPEEGDYEAPIQVTLDAMSGYNIWYTLNGDDPTEGTGSKYTAPITICQTTVLKAVTELDGKWGEVRTFTYEYPPVTISANPVPGEQTSAVSVKLTCSADYAQLFYKLDGGEEQVYEKNDTIDVVKSTQLTVYARYDDQLLAQETFTYTMPEYEINASPGAGSYSAIQTITLSCPGAEELYYNLDGYDPSGTKGVLYTGPFELDHTATVRVRAKVWGQEVASQSFYYQIDVPKVTSNHASGAYKAPLEVKLTTTSNYKILYTTDGSDPKTSPTSIEYNEPIQIRKPVTTVIRAVPVSMLGRYGTASEFRYTFPYQSFTAQVTKAQKRTDYQITITATNTLPEDITVNFYAAAYLDGRMLGVVMEQAELPETTINKSVTISYPYDGLLPDDAVFKVFCLDSTTQEPYLEAIEYPVSRFQVIPILDYVTAEPDAIEGYVGTTVAIKLIGHYINDQPDNLITTYGYYSANEGSAQVVDGGIKLVGEGSTTVTFFCSDGVENKAQVIVPVTVGKYKYEQGFLADLTSDDPLPADAIPISNAQELAALSDSSDGAKTAGKTFYLTCDIQLTGEWTPICGFQGTLDGRGHTVSGLYVSSASKKQLAGLFGSAYNATIKKLAVEIDARGVSAYCSSDVSYAAGLVGHSQDTNYINCYTTGGPVSASGLAPYAGGLGGWLLDTELTRCYAAGDVSGGSKSYVGGLTALSASISNCYRVGQSVTGTEQYNGGTLVTVPNAQSSYSGFDFNSTWQFTQGAFRGLPHLQYQK